MGHCLFCYKTVQQCGDDTEDESGDLEGGNATTAATRLEVCNFLKFTNRLFGKSLDNTTCPCGCGVESRWKNLLSCCQECLTNVARFNEYYHQIKCLEMRMSGRLESLLNVIQYADKVPSRIKAFREGRDAVDNINNSSCCEKCEHQSSFTEISRFRQFIFKHSTKYLKASYPKIQIDRESCKNYKTETTYPNGRKKAKVGLEYVCNPSLSDYEAASVARENSWSSSSNQQMPPCPSGPSMTDTFIARDPPLLTSDTDDGIGIHVENQLEEPSAAKGILSSSSIKVEEDESNINRNACLNNSKGFEGLHPDEMDTNKTTDKNGEADNVESDHDYQPCDTEKEDSAEEYISSVEEQSDQKEEVDFSSCKCKNRLFRNHSHLKYKHTNGKMALSDIDLQRVQLKSVRELKLNAIPVKYQDGAENLACSESTCLMKFNFPEEQEKHSKFHGKFSCELCDTTREFAGDFAEHQLEHATPGKKLCWKCDFMGSEQCFIDHYINTHMDIPNHPFNSCPICKEKFHGAFPIPLLHFVNCHDVERLDSSSKVVRCKVESCSAYFLRKDQLTEHVQSCHKNGAEDGQYKMHSSRCPICSKIISQVKYKKGSARHPYHHPNKTSQGRDKSFLTVNGISMSFGDWAKRKGASYECTIPNCAKKFMTEFELQIHSKLHGNFSCQLCDEKMEFAPDLATHELEHHKDKDETGSPPTPKSCIKCTRCNQNKFIGRRESYTYHFLKQHLKLEMDCLRCPICMAPILGSNPCSLRIGLTTHYNITHNVSEIPPGSVMKCDKCPAYFLKSFQLKKHVQLVHIPVPEENSPYPCRNCGRQFKSKTQSYGHYRNGPIGCRLSKQEMPFVCTARADCGGRFETQEELDLHLHKKICQSANADALVCQMCGKVCLGKGALKAHLRSHNKRVKPTHVCAVCGKTFSEKGKLGVHMLRHKGPESWRFSCSICSKKCITLETLNMHMNSHTKEKPFVCHVCGAKYAQRHNFKIHMETKHPLEIPKGTKRRVEAKHTSARKGKKLKPAPRTETVEHQD